MSTKNSGKVPFRNPADFRAGAKLLREQSNLDATLAAALAGLFERMADIRTTLLVLRDSGQEMLLLAAFDEEDALLEALFDVGEESKS